MGKQAGCTSAGHSGLNLLAWPRLWASEPPAPPGDFLRQGGRRSGHDILCLPRAGTEAGQVTTVRLNLAKVWAGVQAGLEQPLPSSAEPQAGRAVGTSATHSS